MLNCFENLPPLAWQICTVIIFFIHYGLLVSQICDLWCSKALCLEMLYGDVQRSVF